MTNNSIRLTFAFVVAVFLQESHGQQLNGVAPRRFGILRNIFDRRRNRSSSPSSGALVVSTAPSDQHDDDEPSSHEPNQTPWSLEPSLSFVPTHDTNSISRSPSDEPSSVPSPFPSEFRSNQPSQVPSVESLDPTESPPTAPPSDTGVSGTRGLCVIGCTPYVDILRDTDTGIAKYEALVADMAQECDVLVHVGDTIPGAASCERNRLTRSVEIMVQAAAATERMALFAPGDNEIVDCHRHAGRRPGIYQASEARQALLDDLGLHNRSSHRDLTGRYPVDGHNKTETVPGTDRPYDCGFDKYVELDTYAVATLEVVGSHYYLDDEREAYPNQDTVDPLQDRLALYLNAKDCALEWIEASANKASRSGKRALFFALHATFYRDNGREPLGNNGIGDYYDTERLEEFTLDLSGTAISLAYQPLFDKLTETALAYPQIMFYVVHADAHRFTTMRMNPTKRNRGAASIESHHNLMLHQVEGDSRALTMFSKFTVDPDSFQPVTLKQEWSRAAYEQIPYGHSMGNY